MVIFAVARATDGVGQLTETLKWGEPSYLTEKTKSGTTIRLGVSKHAPDKPAIFVNCQTSLIGDFRDHFRDEFAFEGTRGLIVSDAAAIPQAPLSQCIKSALTYHRRK
ncbi:DUF1801 domain-containing protein [Pelagibacterium limicola]|uniref:DUF1801 domain-containing protein n=1 Tax=Pelagibacterium limicola TaxID=2791022 RepID=UPI001FEC84D9|nr:DUF1801 domain-containing protein [Pelagibacterium limicola]